MGAMRKQANGVKLDINIEKAIDLLPSASSKFDSGFTVSFRCCHYFHDGGYGRVGRRVCNDLAINPKMQLELIRSTNSYE